MSQSSKYYNATNTKKAEEMYNLNVDDLMNEEDDLDDVEISDDDDLEKFIQSAGLSKQPTGSSNAQNKSTSEEGTKYLTSAATQLASIQPTGFSKNYLDNISSDSEDENDQELLQQLVAQTKARKGGDTLASGEIGSFSFDKQGSDKLEGDMKSLKMQKEILKIDILDMIEKNERMNEVAATDKLNDQGSQMLSFDNKFYNVQKKLMFYSEYGTIAKKLHFQKDHQFSGIVSAIAVYQNYMFVGNSSGYIRVFDMKSQKEMKPLHDPQIGANKVTSIEIADNGGFLISGYKKGVIALWDLIKYKLMRIVTDAHNSDITNAKIYHVNEVETIFVVSAEDNGQVAHIEFGQKTFLGGYSYNTSHLFKTRLKGTSSIAVQTKNELYPHSYCDKSSLIAFGSLNEIVVCSMRPIGEVFQISKPSFCKEKSLPYIDWGYGLTPGKRDKTVPIFAFAWDRLIQLVYINEYSKMIEMDGFYYSDSEINSLQFMGDSILFVLVNGREVKILHTAKFFPGHCKFLETAKRDDMLNNQFEKVITLTANSELEKGHEISDIRSTILQCQSVMNYNQCVKKLKTNVYFMGSKSVLRGRLYSWKEYIDHIKFQESYDWLTVLKVALEIYNGEWKGFAKLPDEKEVRESKLKPTMKDMIKESVQQMIYKYGQMSSQEKETPAKGALVSDKYQADQITIKVAIEFCLNINAIQYLFTEIYQIFADNQFEEKFLNNLEPFILAGKFRNEIVPDAIVRKLIKFYEDQQKYKVLEKIIQQLDFSLFAYKDELLVTCQHYCMVSALLYLMTSHQEEILNTMFKLMREARSIDYQKDDIYTLTSVDSQKKYEIEKSKAYIGYKLLWIIKIFLEGKMFPYGNLSEEKWRNHVYDISHFVSNEEFYNELLQFDSEQFFKVVSRLFYGQPYRFICSQDEYYTKKQAKGYEKCKSVKDIVRDFQSKASKDEQMLQHYYTFLLLIQAAHLDDLPNDPPFNLEYSAIMEAIKNEIAKTTAIDEETLIKAIKSKKLENADVDALLNQLERQVQFLPHLRIYLVERKKDFVKSFQLNLANSSLRKNIFSWIDEKLEDLQSKGSTIEPFNQLKTAIHDSIKDLIAVDVNQAIQVVDKWYEGSYQDTLILDELADHPEIQFNYLKNFLSKNENKIKQTIDESSFQAEKRPQAQKFMKYLVQHTRLLCKYAPQDVQNYVIKEYYPISECLEICQEYKADKGVAVLQKRNSQYLSAIQTYLGILSKIEQPGLMMEIKKLVGDQVNLTSSEKWDFNQVQKQSKNIQEFDEILQKAVDIAEQKFLELHEEGWFAILEFMSTKVQEVQTKIDQTSSRADRVQLERLKDFMMRRKTAVLKKMPYNISLKVIIDRLNLEFKEIKQLYDHKIKSIKNDEKYQKLAKSILIYELNDISQRLREMNDKGWNFDLTEKCYNCQVFLNKDTAIRSQRLPFKKFSCGHSFHLNCLKGSKCEQCSKLQIEFVSRSEMRKKKNEKEEPEEEEKDKNSLLMAEAGSYSPSKGGSGKSEALFLKQLEVFDSMLENSGLHGSNFS